MFSQRYFAACFFHLENVFFTFFTQWWKASVFGVILVNIVPYSVQMRENTEQKNSEYGHFLRNEQLVYKQLTLKKNTVETIRSDAINRLFSLNLKFNRWFT